jgi:hypothetical protein
VSKTLNRGKMVFFTSMGREHKVMQLRMPLYELRQAPWTSNSSSMPLWSPSASQTISSSMIYTRRLEKEDLVVGVYVLRRCLFITESRPSDIDNFKCKVAVLLHERSRLAHVLLPHRGEAGEEFNKS